MEHLLQELVGGIRARMEEITCPQCPHCHRPDQCSSRRQQAAPELRSSTARALHSAQAQNPCLRSGARVWHTAPASVSLDGGFQDGGFQDGGFECVRPPQCDQRFRLQSRLWRGEGDFQGILQGVGLSAIRMSQRAAP